MCIIKISMSGILRKQLCELYIFFVWDRSANFNNHRAKLVLTINYLFSSSKYLHILENVIIIFKAFHFHIFIFKVLKIYECV